MSAKAFDAHYWRYRAAGAHMLAARMVTVDARVELLDIAARYERLAEWHEGAMKARKLLDGTAFGPHALKVINQAYDEAWHEVAANFGDDAHDIELARERLANAVLSVAHEDSRDVQVLKRGALQRMALDYRER
jgi:hypothetical protein